MIYAKIKLSPILSQENKEDILYDFTTRYGKLAADYMHDPKRDMLQLDDVLKIMDQSQSTYNLTQNENDNRYNQFTPVDLVNPVEIDADSAQKVVLLPPTGENRNYIKVVIPVIIGLSIVMAVVITLSVKALRGKKE